MLRLCRICGSQRVMVGLHNADHIVERVVLVGGHWRSFIDSVAIAVVRSIRIGTHDLDQPVPFVEREIGDPSQFVLDRVEVTEDVVLITHGRRQTGPVRIGDRTRLAG